MKQVLIIYRFLPQYRIEFYNKLKAELHKHEINLSLVYGKSTNQNTLKSDEVDIEWAEYVPNKLFKINNEEIYWQPVLTQIKNKDLVIVEQANKLLINYYLLIKRKFSSQKIAFWGHGVNMQADRNSFGNKFKELITKQVDWWFAYTDGVKYIISDQGFPGKKITVVENSIDTVKLKTNYENISTSEIKKLKNSLGIDSENVGIYCGGIYKEKRVDFLLDACKKIKNKVKDFHFIVIGGGPEAYKFQEFSKENPWLHYVGPKFDQDKLIYFKISKTFLMPGLVGLAILDAFCTNTPLVTTEYPYHSPEIEYLNNKENGLITANNVNDFSKGVIEVLTSSSLHKNLIHGCEQGSQLYSTEKMVNNFSQGIIDCLNT